MPSSLDFTWTAVGKGGLPPSPGGSGGGAGASDCGRGGSPLSGRGGLDGESSGRVGESGLYWSPAAPLVSSDFFAGSELSQRRFFLQQIIMQDCDYDCTQIQ